MTENEKREKGTKPPRERSISSAAIEAVPIGLRVASAYAWRFLVIAAAAGLLVWIVMQLKLVVIPFLIALLLCALIAPAMSLMLRKKFPHWLAVVTSVVGTLAILSGLMWLVVWQVTQQWGSVRDRTVAGFMQFRDFLQTGPLHITTDEIDRYLMQALKLVQDQWQVLANGALSVGTTLGHIATGVLLAVFILICLLADGPGIWRWVLRLVPRRGREATDVAAKAGWKTVKNYGRTQMLVAAIDAAGIGIAAALMGVPLAIPIGVLVFLGAFVPFVGAVLTGFFAVFIALVYNGPLIALLMLLAVLLIQQVEGHLLQPILMGSAVKVHPLAVVLVVAGGAMIAGIPGALFAVPLAAFINVFVLTLSARANDESIRQEDLIWRTVPRERPLR